MRWLAVALAAALVAGPAVQPSLAAITSTVKLRCKDDWKRLCPAYSAGTARMRACMEAKASQISTDCVRALIDAGEVQRSRVRR